MNKDWKTIDYNGIKVFYYPQLDGGGIDFGQEFIQVVRDKIGRVDKLCEFACGPGFIGFSLLAHDLCNNLCLIDINPQAIECCLKTIEFNRLKKVVRTYTSDVLSQIPKKEIWDLVVSNPPHFDGTKKMYKHDLLAIDPGWYIHKAFYKKIPRHLSKKGSVLFVENEMGAKPSMWSDFIFKHSQGKVVNVEIFSGNQTTRKFLARSIKIFQLLGLKKIINQVLQIIKDKNVHTTAKKIYPFYFVWAKK